MLECVRTRSMTLENVRKDLATMENIRKHWKRLDDIRKHGTVKSILMLEKSRLKVRNQCLSLNKKFFDLSVCDLWGTQGVPNARDVSTRCTGAVLQFEAKSADPDMMCPHEAQQQPDWSKFEQATQDKIVG